MPRAPRPEDLYQLRVPTDLALSPDARWVAFAVKSVAPNKDGYRSSLWVVPADGSGPARQITVGAKTDTAPRWSPDGRTIAFLSDRGAVLQAGGAGLQAGKAEAPKLGATQVWLLPFADGGEARQLTTLPRDVEAIAWSPDSRRLCVVSAATRPDAQRKTERAPGEPPEPDTRLIDRLRYQFNGIGFVEDRYQNLWLIDVATGSAERLTGGASHDLSPAWSPDGKRVAFASDGRGNADLTWRQDIYLLDLASRATSRLSPGRGNQYWSAPAWSPDGRWIAAVGRPGKAARGSKQEAVWRFRVRDGAGDDLTGETDLEANAAMNSDLFGGGEARLHWEADEGAIIFSAPVEGSFELWRVDPESKAVERLTRERHYLGRHDTAVVARGRTRIAAVRTSGNEPPDVVVGEVGRGKVPAGGLAMRRVTNLMQDAWADVALVKPVERLHEVDGRRVQGWFIKSPAGSKSRPAPVVVEIHGGPATLYGWSLIWEWQVLAASGVSVYACNPRGSQGYGQEFLSANYQDWGDGPMHDVLAGLDGLIEDGLADPARTGVTGGSYGGYLTSWIVGHTDRFKAAVTCRSVNDMTSQMLSGDIGGPVFGRYEYGVNPWQDWNLYRDHSPLTYAQQITTPLLIQHSEKDLRCPITQAEELFAALRSLRRPVRLMRVPEESHELTRSGTPFRRVDNLRLINEWFVHYLVEGRRGLPRVNAGRG